jgi:hypothetical protein
LAFTFSAAAFRPGRLGFRATVTPRLSGSVTLVRWSHRFSIVSGIDELSKEGTFCSRPALVNNAGSMRMIHLFRACVKFFRYIRDDVVALLRACGSLVRPVGVSMAQVRIAAMLKVLRCDLFGGKQC